MSGGPLDGSRASLSVGRLRSVRLGLVRLAIGIVLLLLAADARAQRLRGPHTAAPGSTIDIQVTNPGLGGVELSDGGPQVTRFPIGPSGRASIPVPAVPVGTILFLRVGRGVRATVHLVEVVDG